MRVKYLKDVTSPPTQYGRKGEVRDIEKSIAIHLIKSGYVEDAENPAPKPEPRTVNKLVETNNENSKPNRSKKKNDTDERTDTAGK